MLEEGSDLGSRLDKMDDRGDNAPCSLLLDRGTAILTELTIPAFAITLR